MDIFGDEKKANVTANQLVDMFQLCLQEDLFKLNEGNGSPVSNSPKGMPAGASPIIKGGDAINESGFEMNQRQPTATALNNEFDGLEGEPQPESLNRGGENEGGQDKPDGLKIIPINTTDGNENNSNKNENNPAVSPSEDFLSSGESPRPVPKIDIQNSKFVGFLSQFISHYVKEERRQISDIIKEAAKTKFVAVKDVILLISRLGKPMKNSTAGLPQYEQIGIKEEDAEESPQMKRRRSSKEKIADEIVSDGNNNDRSQVEDEKPNPAISTFRDPRRPSRNGSETSKEFRKQNSISFMEEDKTLKLTYKKYARREDGIVPEAKMFALCRDFLKTTRGISSGKGERWLKGRLDHFWQQRIRGLNFTDVLHLMDYLSESLQNERVILTDHSGDFQQSPSYREDQQSQMIDGSKDSLRKTDLYQELQSGMNKSREVQYLDVFSPGGDNNQGVKERNNKSLHPQKIVLNATTVLTPRHRREKGLKEIFDFYALEQMMIGKYSTFETIKEAGQYVTPGSLTIFLKDFELTGNSKLTRSKILGIIRRVSANGHSLDFAQFLEVLDKISELYYERDESVPTVEEKREKFYSLLGCDDAKIYRPKLKGVRIAFSTHEKSNFRTSPDLIHPMKDAASQPQHIRGKHSEMLLELLKTKQRDENFTKPLNVSPSLLRVPAHFKEIAEENKNNVAKRSLSPPAPVLSPKPGHLEPIPLKRHRLSSYLDILQFKKSVHSSLNSPTTGIFPSRSMFGQEKTLLASKNNKITWDNLEKISAELLLQPEGGANGKDIEFGNGVKLLDLLNDNDDDDKYYLADFNLGLGSPPSSNTMKPKSSSNIMSTLPNEITVHPPQENIPFPIKSPKFGHHRLSSLQFPYNKTLSPPPLDRMSLDAGLLPTLMVKKRR